MFEHAGDVKIDVAALTAICTPSDEVGVDRVEEHGYHFIKIASCALTDWPLLERIIRSQRPVIASLAGEELDMGRRGEAFVMATSFALDELITNHARMI